MRITGMLSIGLALIGLTLIGLSGTGRAAAEGTPPANRPEAAPTLRPELPPFEVQGFRSARFEMTEDEVRRAILHDFPAVKADGIRSEETPTERNQVLLVKVPDVIEKGGTAQLMYVLGYTSHRLIQVNVLWSKDTDPAVTPAMLVGNATLLSNYFQRHGFKPGSVTRNAPLASGDGVLFFRGADARNRTVVLMLMGTTTEAKPGEAKPGEAKPDPAPPVRKELTPTTLRLSYIADPVTPDIFRIKPGQF